MLGHRILGVGVGKQEAYASPWDVDLLLTTDSSRSQYVAELARDSGMRSARRGGGDARIAALPFGAAPV